MSLDLNSSCEKVSSSSSMKSEIKASSENHQQDVEMATSNSNSSSPKAATNGSASKKRPGDAIKSNCTFYFLCLQFLGVFQSIPGSLISGLLKFLSVWIILLRFKKCLRIFQYFHWFPETANYILDTWVKIFFHPRKLHYGKCGAKNAIIHS